MTFLLKILTGALLLALAETVNGILRIRLLTRLLGARHGRIVSLLTGCALIFGLTWLLLPWLAPAGTMQLLTVGSVWLVVLLGYDLFVGRVLFRQPWARIAEDFDLCRGNYLSLGMVFLLFCPLLVAWLQS